MSTLIVFGLAWGLIGGKCGWSLWHTLGTWTLVFVALKLATYALTGSTEWP